MMKQPLFFLLALGVGLSLATAAPGARDGAISKVATAIPSDERPATQDRDDDRSSPRALCKQVEVQLDEGYGVSSRETRVVCDQDP